MEEPISQLDHHLGDLLDQVPSFQSMNMTSVATTLKSISTESYIISSMPISSISSTDIIHPLTSVFLSMDVFHSSHPLTSSNEPSTDIPSTDISHPLINFSSSIFMSTADKDIAETLLGLRGEVSSVERQPWELAKGEVVESQAFSSSLEKGEELSGPLERVSEGEVRVCVSQGEPLMQEHREIERKAGVNEGSSEMEFQKEYQSVIDSISLDPETFTHGFSAYQTLARQDNQQREPSI